VSNFVLLSFQLHRIKPFATSDKGGPSSWGFAHWVVLPLPYAHYEILNKVSDKINSAYDRDQWRVLVNTVIAMWVVSYLAETL
jgi:hypothetical protein